MIAEPIQPTLAQEYYYLLCSSLETYCRICLYNPDDYFDEKSECFYGDLISAMADQCIHLIERFENEITQSHSESFQITLHDFILFYNYFTVIERDCVNRAQMPDDPYCDDFDLKINALVSFLEELIEAHLTPAPKTVLNLCINYMDYAINNNPIYNNTKREYNILKVNKSTENEKINRIGNLQETNTQNLNQNLFGREFILHLDEPAVKRNQFIIRNILPIIKEDIGQRDGTQPIDYTQELRNFALHYGIYCLLHDEEPWCENLLQEDKGEENKKVIAEKREASEPFPQLVREEMVNVYTKLAGEIGIDTEYISQVFKTDDKKLWDAINESRMGKKHDGFPYQNVKLVPFLALIGVLKKQKKIGGMKEYVNKINAGFDKDAAYQICKDCSQSDPDKRPQLAEEIIYRLQ